MITWLKWSIYTIAAIVVIGVLVSSGAVFLALGAIISLMAIGALVIALVAAGIKELWEHWTHSPSK